MIEFRMAKQTPKNEVISVTGVLNVHIFKNLNRCDKCRKSCSDNCFTVLDTASTYNQLKIKEALHIMWEKPMLNKQVKHFDTSLSF